MKRLVAMVIAAVLGLGDAMAQDADEFAEAYRCQLRARLEQIYLSEAEADRFLILSLKRPQSYVQCLLGGGLRDSEVLCEVASGFEGPWFNGRPQYSMPTVNVARVSTLGFNTRVSNGNFQRRIFISSEADLDALADLMLRALQGGFSARLDEEIEVTAPLASEAPLGRDCEGGAIS